MVLLPCPRQEASVPGAGRRHRQPTSRRLCWPPAGSAEAPGERGRLTPLRRERRSPLPLPPRPWAPEPPVPASRRRLRAARGWSPLCPGRGAWPVAPWPQGSWHGAVLLRGRGFPGVAGTGSRCLPPGVASSRVPGKAEPGQGLWMTPLVLAALDFVLSSPVPFHRWHASQGLPPSPERASVTQPLGVGGSAADPKGRVRISECPQAAPSMQGDGVASHGLTAEWRLPATRFAPRQRQRAGQAPAMWGASRPRLVRAEPARGPVPGRCVPCSGRAGDGGVALGGETRLLCVTVPPARAAVVAGGRLRSAEVTQCHSDLAEIPVPEWGLLCGFRWGHPGV